MKLLTACLAILGLLLSANGTHAANLPQTGQTRCYGELGAELTSCVNTGEDGEIRAGVPWPSPRFTVEGECITDNLTGLMWSKDANLLKGARNWDDSIDYTRSMALCGYSDWRMPNKNEMNTLFNGDTSDKTAWLTDSGFVNVKDWYWTSTTYLPNTSSVWSHGRHYESFWLDSPKSVSIGVFLWPVRTKVSDAPAPPLRTGQTISYRQGDDGDLQKGASVSGPRFVDHGNGAVTDRLTGLMFTKDTYAPGPDACGPGRIKTWGQGQEYIACVNQNHFLGYTDWRIPNKNELLSLVDRGRKEPALPENHPFLNVSTFYGYYTSTLHPDLTSSFCTVEFKYGLINGIARGNTCIWPVRGGHVEPPATLPVYGTNYNVANIRTVSNEFQIWLDLAVNGEPRTDVCTNFSFVMKTDRGEAAIQTGTGTQCEDLGEGQSPNTRRYRIEFRITLDAVSPRAAYFEQGKLYACNKDAVCAQLPGLTDFSVYGTAFDIQKHAWSFANGRWMDGVSGDIFERIAKSIKEHIPWYERKKFTAAFFEHYAGWRNPDARKPPKGGCYGLTSAAIANFTHAGKASWGTDGTDGNESYNEQTWQQEIANHWSATADHAVAPFKPFVTDAINSAAETVSSGANAWTPQAAKKIIYYFAAQPLIWENVNPLEWDNWVREDDLTPVDDSRTSTLIEILKSGSPVSLSLDSNKGLHTLAATQLLTYNGTRKYTIWDNNRPYPYRYQSEIQELDSRYAPYLQYKVEGTYKGAEFIELVGKADGQGDRSARPYQLNCLPKYLSGDSQNIYNLPAFAAHFMKAGEMKPRVGASTAVTQTTDYSDHIEVALVGASVQAVQERTSGNTIAVVPNGEITANQASIRTTGGGRYNFLYLPASGSYKIAASKYPDFSFLEVYVTVPNADGTVESLNYENVATGPTDVTDIYFYVGRNNSDKAIRRSLPTAAGSNIVQAADMYDPDYQGTLAAVIASPTDFAAIYESRAVRLSWTNPSQPTFSRVQIMRKENGFPVSMTNGTLVYSGTATEFSDTAVQSGRTYYYAAFCLDTLSATSTPAYAPVNTSLYSIYGTTTTGAGALSGATLVAKDETGRAVTSASSGAGGTYVLSNVPNGIYTIEVSHPSHRFSSPAISVTVNNTSVRWDFEGTPQPALALVSVPASASVGDQITVQWAYRNIDNGKSVALTLNRNGTDETVAANIPIIKGQATWTVTAPAASSAALRIVLEDDRAVYAETSLQIGEASGSSISLQKGWSLVSLPLQPDNTAISSVLSGIAGSYQVVWGYANQSWKFYNPLNPQGSTLTTMEAGKGYWIKMTEAKTLSGTGSAPPSSLSLATGWNLVGYNGASCTAATGALSFLSGNLQVSWGYPAQAWKFYNPQNVPGSTLTEMCPGYGYWIKVQEGGMWGGW